MRCEGLHIRHILKSWRERWWWLGSEKRKMDRCEGYLKNRTDDLVTNWMYRESEKSRMIFRDLTRAAGVYWLSGLSCKTNSRTHHWCTEYRELHTELGNDLKQNGTKLCASFWYSAFLTKLCELKAIIYMRETHDVTSNSVAILPNMFFNQYEILNNAYYNPSWGWGDFRNCNLTLKERNLVPHTWM